MDEKEIVLVNKSKGRFTINFQGAFVNKHAVKDGKFYLTEKEYDFVKSTYPHILEGKTKRLYLESELDESGKAESIEQTDKEFFAQHHNTVKKAISKMDKSELEKKYKYVKLHEDEVSPSIVKAIEDRMLELDKKGE